MTKDQLDAIRRLSLKLGQPIETYRSEGGNVRVVCLTDDREYFVRPNGSVETVRSERSQAPDRSAPGRI